MISLATWFERGAKSSSGQAAELGDEPEDVPSCEASEDQNTEIAVRMRREIEEELSADFEIRLQSERSAALSDFRNREAERIDAQVQQLLTSIANAVEELKSTLARDLGKLLSPFLSEKAVATAYDEFVETVLETLLGETATSLTICAPEPLLGAMRERCANATMQVNFIVSDNVEARATCNETVVETRIAEFLKASGQVAP